MVLPLIVFSSSENGQVLERPMTVFYDGTPFYFSATNPLGTAFPLMGITENGSIVHLDMNKCDPLSQLIPTLKKYSKNVNWELFGSLKNLIVSSLLGKGIWDTALGATVKEILMRMDPDFYQQYRASICFEEEITKYSEVDGVNAWIRKQKYKLIERSLSNQFALGIKIEDIPDRKQKSFSPSNYAIAEPAGKRYPPTPIQTRIMQSSSEDLTAKASLPNSPRKPVKPL